MPPSDPARTPLPLDGDGGPVFAEPWQAQLFAITVQLSESGHFTWPEWAARFGDALKRASRDGAPADGSAYYDAWLEALEGLLAERDLASPQALAGLKDAWAAAYRETPHGKPVALKAR